MNGDLLEHPLTRIDELVGNASRRDHNMPAIHFYRALTDSKGGMTLLYHKDLFIRVLAQPGTTARGSLHPEKRNGNASMFPSLKQIAVSMAELLSGNEVCHVFSPRCCSIASQSTQVWRAQRSATAGRPSRPMTSSGVIRSTCGITPRTV